MLKNRYVFININGNHKHYSMLLLAFRISNWSFEIWSRPIYKIH